MGNLQMTSMFPDVSLDISRNLKILTMAEFKLWPDEFKMLAILKKTDLKIDKQMRYEGSGAATQKPEGETSDQRRIYEGWIETAIQTTFSIEFPITWEQRKYAIKNAEFMQQIGAYCARSMKLVKEYDTANIINNGFSATYAGGDTVAYFSASHTWKSDGSAFSNLLSAATLSRTAVENAFITIANAKMESNIPAAMLPKKINICYQNIFTLPELLKTVKDPDNANNTYNVIQDYDLKPNLNHYMNYNSGKTYVVDTEVNTRDLIISEETKFDSYMDNPTNSLIERGMAAHATMFHDQLGSFGSQGA